MNQPPDDDFYKSSTEVTEHPPQGDFPKQNLPNQRGLGQQNLSPQGPVSRPGFGPGQQSFPSQGPLSQPGFGPPGRPQGPASQPGFGPQSYPGPMDQRGPGPRNSPSQGLGNQASFGQQRPPGFPPPSGPISQPGFSSAGQAQQNQYPAQPPLYPGNNPQSGGAIAPWEPQQPNMSTRQPQQSGAFPREQASPNAPVNWPNLAKPQPPTKPKRSMLMLAVALIGLVLLVLGSGAFVLFSRTGNSTSATPTPLKTASSNRGTPVTTHPAGTPTVSTGAFNTINTPVQAGANWIVTITSVKTTTSSLIAPNAGNTYLEIHLTLKNTSSKTLTVISIIQFTLTDASGQRHNETATDTNISRPPDGNINANQTLNAQLAYEVPTSQHTFVLTFAYGLSTNSNGSTTWKFTA